MDSLEFDKEYILFCDESDKEGRFYSNFYGGVIVGSSHYERITSALNGKKAELNLFGEVKWEKITERYQQKYIDLVRFFFTEIASGHLKIRVMFRQNAYITSSLTSKHNEDQYYLLYYQFIKNAFGFECLQPAPAGVPVRVRVYVDQIGDTHERINRFRGYIHALPSNKRFSKARFHIPFDEITEVCSHEHVLMQCLDIVLGSMTFRLNNKHKAVLPETQRRGKRTKAKEAVYKVILSEIRGLYKNFNIGVSTAPMSTCDGRWKTPYCHWSFKSKDGEINRDLTKRGGQKNKNPI